MYNEEHRTQENKKENLGNHSSNRSSSQSTTYQHRSNTHLQSHLHGPPRIKKQWKNYIKRCSTFFGLDKRTGQKFKKGGSWRKTKSLPVSTERGCKSHIQLTPPKVSTSTYYRKSKTEYDCPRDSHPPIFLQYEKKLFEPQAVPPIVNT